MSTDLPGVTTRRASLPARIGLVLAVVLAVLSIITWVPQFSDGPVLAGVVVAVDLTTLVALPFAWRGALRARVVVIVTRVLSALTGLPAFFIPDIPAQAVMMVSAGILLSLVVAVLLLIGPKSAR
ncbi:hypothetical protein ACFY05_25165 [Microtetraspora fusca]|uniref:Integral membrane protein n=1 Tax=Microtetraspora fusca TaxID=1997 RepID=A0ABW6VDG8_MICFU